MSMRMGVRSARRCYDSVRVARSALFVIVSVIDCIESLKCSQLNVCVRCD